MLDHSTTSRNGSKPTRNADLRHSQALGRLRTQHPEMTPQHNAKCIHAIIRKRMAENQPIEDLTQYGLTDDVWIELVDMLSNDELAALNAASRQDDIDPDEPVDAAFSHGEPIPFAVAPEPQPVAPVATAKPDLPRFAEPRFVHSLKWRDSDGCEHLHVVRSDDLDEVLREIALVKAFIKATRARDEKPVATAPAPQAEPATEPEPTAQTQQGDDTCPTHGTRRLKPSRYGGLYCTGRVENNEFCKFKSGRK